MKKSRQQIKDRLKELSESELRKILIAYFTNMSFFEVCEPHGVNEFGKDIAFYDKDKFEKIIWYACVVKAKDIYQSDFETVSRQINECFRKKYPSHHHGNVTINKVLVITSGIYKDNAKYQIADLMDDKSNNDKVEYWDCGDIAEKIDTNNLLDILFGHKNIIQNTFNNETLKILITDSSIKLIEIDFNVKIESLDNFHINIRTRAKELENEREEYLKSMDLLSNKIPVKILPEINELLKSSKFILLHGIATSGKTTILKKLGKDFINSDIKGYVFFYELSKIKNNIINTGLDKLCNQAIYDKTLSKIDVLNLTDDSIVLLLLDGLDEIYDTKERDIVLEEIMKLKSIKKIKIVVTSRTNNFINENNEIKDNFESFELLPLTLNEMIELGSKLLNESKQEEGFIKLLKKNEIIQSFPKTPLTTILLAILFKEEKIDIKELPKNITELYSKFLDVFLNKWDKNKGISEQFKHQEKQFVIQKIAEYMHLNGLTSIPEDKLFKEIIKITKEHPITGFKSPKDFLENLCQRCSIIVKDDFDKTYKFFHLTIQEYLTAALMNNNDEDLLFNKFYDNWWLNANIFYAGKTPHKSNILNRLSTLSENYPSSEDARIAYIIHTSKVLQASHLLDNNSRTNTLKAMVKIFDELIKELISDLIVQPDVRFKKRSILEVILWARRFFNEFFSSIQFMDSLEIIRLDLLNNPIHTLTDITEYCVSFCIATKKYDSTPLYDFLINKKDVNPRWFKIIDVDVKIKNLEVSDRKLVAKFKSKALKNKDYIKRQFKDRIEKHYNSITGLS